MSFCSCCAAANNGVNPSWSGTSIAAPNSWSFFTSSIYPCCAQTNTGVVPSFLAIFKSAPKLWSCTTVFKWPKCAATYKAVPPILVWTSTFWPWLRTSVLIIERWPFIAAAWIEERPSFLGINITFEPPSLANNSMTCKCPFSAATYPGVRPSWVGMSSRAWWRCNSVMTSTWPNWEAK